MDITHNYTYVYVRTNELFSFLCTYTARETSIVCATPFSLGSGYRRLDLREHAPRYLQVRHLPEFGKGVTRSSAVSGGTRLPPCVAVSESYSVSWHVLGLVFCPRNLCSSRCGFRIRPAGLQCTDTARVHDRLHFVNTTLKGVETFEDGKTLL